VKNNLDEQQIEIYGVLKQKFEDYAKQQIAMALKIVQVCNLAVVSESGISDLYIK
jgi:hypothetical protein